MTRDKLVLSAVIATMIGFWLFYYWLFNHY